MGFWNYINNFGKTVTSAFDRAGEIGRGISNAFSGVGKDILGDDVESVIDNITGETANKQWQEQMDYQRNYYQNMVDSMLKAGLNPAMLSGGSASGSMPGGASATGNTMNLGTVGALIDSLSGLGLTRSKIANTNADTEKKVADTIGQKIDNQIKEKVGLDQAFANLGLANLNIAEKKEAIRLLVEKYGLVQAQTNKTLSEAEKVKFEADSVRIANELQEKKLDELDSLGDYNGRMVTLTESQAGTLSSSAKFFGLGASGSGTLSQLTSTQIPLIWYVKATNQNLSAETRKQYCERVLWLLQEDTGDKEKDLKKASK